MNRLRVWLREWLGIDSLYRDFDSRIARLKNDLSAADSEIDRLRGLIYAVEPAKKTLKPRTWREAKQLLGQD